MITITTAHTLTTSVSLSLNFSHKRNVTYCKTLHFRCISISCFSSLENSRHFNLEFLLLPSSQLNFFTKLAKRPIFAGTHSSYNAYSPRLFDTALTRPTSSFADVTTTRFSIAFHYQGLADPKLSHFSTSEESTLLLLFTFYNHDFGILCR